MLSVGSQTILRDSHTQTGVHVAPSTSRPGGILEPHHCASGVGITGSNGHSSLGEILEDRNSHELDYRAEDEMGSLNQVLDIIEERSKIRLDAIHSNLTKKVHELRIKRSKRSMSQSPQERTPVPIFRHDVKLASRPTIRSPSLSVDRNREKLLTFLNSTLTCCI
jgi:hypothetical protein